jgi:beta-galactosidase
VKWRIACWLLACFVCAVAQAQTKPLLGAQVWIEPGQTPEQINGWFRQLREEHMPVARIFVMWSYLEVAPGKWDFALYDTAFRSAEKYHVKIVATLTPSGPPPFLGGNGNQGGGFSPTEEARKSAAEYIGRIVERYKGSAALDTWLLVNEPGMAPATEPLAVAEFRTWLSSRYASVQALNTKWGTAYGSFQSVDPAPATGQFASENRQIDWLDFWRHYQTEQLRWIEEQVRSHDPDNAHGIHVNPHALVGNLAGLSDDLPSWRPFLDTLGCSIHPAWHFGLLDRDQYALGVSYINDLVAGSVEPKPHWVTELQGGNNIYSSNKPMDPTADDIAQWVWTSIGAGADRVIFWLLNARLEGTEAAEWSLLDFEQRPSVRLTTASEIAKLVDANEDFFVGAHPVESPISVILSLETMTLEARYNDTDYPGRDRNAHILEALGMYQSLSQIGVPPRVKHFGDYDWRAASSHPRLAILPDARAITNGQVSDLEAFVANGNTLLITGLSGFYDPHAKAWPLAGFPLGRVTGADLKEIHFIGPRTDVPLTSPAITLPSHLWISSIENRSATVIGRKDGEIIATERQTANGGKVIWIPSPIGMGAWLNESQPLTGYLQSLVDPFKDAEPFRFPRVQKGCLMRVLKKGDAYLTVVTNGEADAVTCDLEHPSELHATKLWGQAPGDSKAAATYVLAPRGTSVTLWR